MATTNIERFNEIVGVIFGILYDSFPVKTEIMAVDVVGQDEINDQMNVHESLRMAFDEDVIFFFDTVDWLQETGYLTGVRSSDGIHGTVLTAKGLEVLKAMPGSLETPLGARISESVKSEGKTLLRSLASQALGIGLQIATRDF